MRAAQDRTRSAVGACLTRALGALAIGCAPLGAGAALGTAATAYEKRGWLPD